MRGRLREEGWSEGLGKDDTRDVSVRTFMSVEAMATPTESRSAAASSAEGTGTSEMSSLKGKRWTQVSNMRVREKEEY